MTPRIVHRLDKLDAYHRALALAAQVASVARTPPFEDHPNRRTQLERAAESIYANVAEGSACGRNRNYARFVQYAIASSSELEAHLAFARRIHAISVEAYSALSDETIEVRKMLIGLKCSSSAPQTTEGAPLTRAPSRYSLLPTPYSLLLTLCCSLLSTRYS